MGNRLLIQSHFESEVGINLYDPGWIDTDPGGGQSTLTHLKVKLGFELADPGWINTDPGYDTHLKVKSFDSNIGI